MLHWNYYQVPQEHPTWWAKLSGIRGKAIQIQVSAEASTQQSTRQSSVFLPVQDRSLKWDVKASLFDMLVSYWKAPTPHAACSRRSYSCILFLHREPMVSSVQQHPSYSFKLQEAVRIAPGSEELSGKVTHASWYTTGRQAFQRADGATAAALVESSRLQPSSAFHAHCLPQRANSSGMQPGTQVQQPHRTDSKVRSLCSAPHFQQGSFPATITNSCLSIHSSKDEFPCFLFS